MAAYVKVTQSRPEKLAGLSIKRPQTSRLGCGHNDVAFLPATSGQIPTRTPKLRR
jgi:hypothetical protein